MKKFKLKFCLTAHNKPQYANFSDANKSSREYRALKIMKYSAQRTVLVNQKALKIMQKIGSHLRYLELKLSFVSITNVSVARAFFESMPQLEDLKVDGCRSFQLNSQIEPVNMKKLKSIVLRESCADVIFVQISMC